MTSRKFFIALAALFAFFSPAGGAVDKLERDDTVDTRRHPELEALGISADSFYLFPAYAQSIIYNSNLFSADRDVKDDILTVVSPAAALKSNWNRHSVSVSAAANIGRHASFSNEDYDDWYLVGFGETEVLRALHASARTYLAFQHESRQSPDNAGGITPTIARSNGATFQLRYKRGVFGISSAFAIERSKYEDVESIRSGTPAIIQQNDRNNRTYSMEARGTYGNSATRSVYFSVRANKRDYDRLQQVTGFDRSSRGYEAGVGGNYDFGGITRGSAFIGYRFQNYKGSLPDIKAPVFDFQLIWKPSEMTTVLLEAGRRFTDTTTFSYSGIVSTSASFRLSHELKRNVVINLSHSRVFSEFYGVGNAERDDDSNGSAVQLRWVFSRWVTLSAKYEYTERDSQDSTLAFGAPTDDFSRHVTWLRLELQR